MHTSRSTGRAALVGLLVAAGCTTPADDPQPDDATVPDDTMVSVDTATSCQKGSFEKETGVYLCPVDVVCDPGPVFGITAAALSSSVGFNLDGINNSSATGGGSVGGCGQVDATGGVDAAFTTAVASSAGVLDLGAALRASLLGDGGDATTSAATSMRIELFGLSNTFPSDSCFTARLTLRTEGQPDVVRTASGARYGDVAEVSFVDAPPTTLWLRPELPTTSCVGGSCDASAALPLVVRGLRMRLVLNPEHTALLPASVLGGYVFVRDCEGGTAGPLGTCTGGAFAALNPSGFAASFASYAAAAHLDPAVETAVMDGALVGRDLRVGTNEQLTPCTGVSNATVNPNAISIAIGIEGAL